MSEVIPSLMMMMMKRRTTSMFLRPFGVTLLLMVLFPAVVTSDVSYASGVQCTSLQPHQMTQYCAAQAELLVVTIAAKLDQVYQNYGLQQPPTWDSNGGNKSRRDRQLGGSNCQLCKYYPYPSCLYWCSRARVAGPPASTTTTNSTADSILSSVTTILIDLYGKLSNNTLTGQQVSTTEAPSLTDDLMINTNGTGVRQRRQQEQPLGASTVAATDDGVGDDQVGLDASSSSYSSNIFSSADMSRDLAKSLEQAAYSAYQQVAALDTTSADCRKVLQTVVCDAATEQEPVESSMSVMSSSSTSSSSMTASTTTTCANAFCRADFAGAKQGDWIKSIGCGITVAASSRVVNVTGGVFGGPKRRRPMILDTTKPEANNTDLGSPNAACSPSGPGRGAGGVPGVAGANCIDQGKVLIISKDGNQTNPKVNDKGGKVVFTFNTTVRVEAIGLLNNAGRRGSIAVVQADGTVQTFKPTPLGPNSMQVVRLGVDHAVKLRVKLFKRAAISFVDIVQVVCP